MKCHRYLVVVYRLQTCLNRPVSKRVYTVSARLTVCILIHVATVLTERSFGLYMLGMTVTKIKHHVSKQHSPFKAGSLRDAPTRLTFNNCKLCPHSIYVFCIYLRKNSDLCHLQHKLIGFYNRDEKCAQRGTDWVFK